MRKDFYGLTVIDTSYECGVTTCSKAGIHTVQNVKLCTDHHKEVENKMKGCVSTGSGRTYDIVYPSKGEEYTSSDKIPGGTMFTGSIGGQPGLYLKRGGMVVGLEKDLAWACVCHVKDYKPVQATITVKG